MTVYDNQQRWMTVSEYAAMIGKDPRTVRQYCQDGLIPDAAKGPKPLGEWRIPVKETATSAGSATSANN